MTIKNNPFAKVGASPKLGAKTYSVEQVKAANRRFYEKFPEAVQPAAMIKKAILDPGDEVVKQASRESTEYPFLPKFKYTVGGL
jgi:hypothetical protein|tara:strand:+ start:1294 stop:1545 length:252 start_codon:yes stop_codon:yes gene_type:complete